MCVRACVCVCACACVCVCVHVRTSVCDGGGMDWDRQEVLGGPH